MEIRLGTLVDAQVAAAVLNQAKGLSSVAAYRIMKNCKAIGDEAESYEKQRIKLCEKYANKDEEGNPLIVKDEPGIESYDIPKEKFEKYKEELKALQDEMVEIKIRKVALKDIDAAGLSPALMGDIEFMLEVEEEV